MCDDQQGEFVGLDWGLKGQLVWKARVGKWGPRKRLNVDYSM